MHEKDSLSNSYSSHHSHSALHSSQHHSKSSSKSNNFWLAVILIFFIISYLVLWFLGGACTGFLKSGTCYASNSLNFLKNIPIVNLVLPYANWNSAMFFFAPIAGFIFAIFFINWYNAYFSTKEASSILFLALVLFGLFFGYYINLFWHYDNIAKMNDRYLTQNLQASYAVWICLDESTCYDTVSKLNNEAIAQAIKNNSTKVTLQIPVNYWPELRSSFFLVFVLGAIAGWLPLFIRDHIVGSK